MEFDLSLLPGNIILDFFDQLMRFLNLVRRGGSIGGVAIPGGEGIVPGVHEAAGLGQGYRDIVASLCGIVGVALQFPVADGEFVGVQVDLDPRRARPTSAPMIIELRTSAMSGRSAFLTLSTLPR